MLKISPPEFKELAKYIFEISGISLQTGKEYLIETRLNPLVEAAECKNYSEFHRKAKADRTKKLEKDIVDAISTNETYFFRDGSPFQLLQHKLVPDVIDRKSKLSSRMQVPIRIWSAACSSGQEVYSIAITLKELLGDLSGYNIKILGTDISNAVITQASYGRYNKFEVGRGLTPVKTTKYFNKDGDFWRIKDEIRSLATFRKINLMQPFVGLGKFDIVFFRNVAIYFTQEDRNKLYEKIAGVLEPQGVLVIGSTESLANDTKLFAPQKYLKSVYYEPKKK